MWNKTPNYDNMEGMCMETSRHDGDGGASDMGKKAHFQIVYDGPALVDHEMDIRDLAPALLAISDLLDESNRVLNGDKSVVSVRVKGTFKTGSFSIDFSVFQGFVDQVFGLITSKKFETAAAILSILGFTAKEGLIFILGKIKHRKIKSIHDDNNNPRIIMEDGDVINLVDRRLLELLNNSKIRRSIEKTIYDPLSKAGIDTFAVAEIEKNYMPLIIEKSEKESFLAPEEDDIETDESAEKLLYLVSPTLHGSYKWRFAEDDGEGSFFATMSDKDFLVDMKSRKIVFATDDMLKVQLRTRQSFHQGRLQITREIERVLKHIPGPRQVHMSESPKSPK
jgi:hypothetical protein